ncbi:lipid A biosynthesis acyltransferase [Taibaiella sp. KBW10]|uniref:lysophospholipid acyltransferase family protein n=1 Tax=Taibaiella sp. KBW10 TaxID=2153357 RepID=UPI000F59F583|nr:lysophospholipid acyltransferase family protein [Taibaiella sp. KBW10]RQO32600.1 lipid A biosynthesis acyltransferase [Taibaiella sp. KBW10]
MIAYCLAYPILYLISFLPFRVLYGFSTFVKFILFDMIGYRKKVILGNLRHAFPEKTESEIQVIARQFYQYFCDMMLETVKSMTISAAALQKRFLCTDALLKDFQYFADQKKSVIIVMGHHGNWEWGGNSFGLNCPQQLYAIFRPLHNVYFNNLIIRIRTRFKTKLMTDRDVIGAMRRLKREGSVIATAFLADQVPASKSVYWTQFLNQETAVFWGTERSAISMNMPVIYADIKRVKRGYYRVEGRILVEDPQQYKTEGLISELHTRALEQDIIAQPETWLWTHRRWKRQKPPTSL